MASTKRANAQAIVDDFFAVKKATIKKRVDAFVDGLMDELKTDVLQLIVEKNSFQESALEVKKSTLPEVKRSRPGSPEPASSVDNFMSAESVHDLYPDSSGSKASVAYSKTLTKSPVNQVQFEKSLPIKEPQTDHKNAPKSLPTIRSFSFKKDNHGSNESRSLESQSSELGVWQGTQSIVRKGWSRTKNLGKSLFNAIKEPFSSKKSKQINFKNL